MSLPYPESTEIDVFTDDGRWPERWFNRPAHEIQALFVARYVVPTDEDGDVYLSSEEWDTFAEQAEKDHPGCIFLY